MKKKPPREGKAGKGVFSAKCVDSAERECIPVLNGTTTPRSLRSSTNVNPESFTLYRRRVVLRGTMRNQSGS